MNRFFTLLTLALFLTAGLSRAREFSVVTYNVENLFDADGISNYGEYVPSEYTPKHLLAKLQNIARILAKADSPNGPDVIVFNEIEIDQSPETTVSDYSAWLESTKEKPIASILSEKRLAPEFAGIPAEAWLLKACEEAGLKGYHVIITSEKSGDAYSGGRPRTVRNVIFSRFPVLATKSHHSATARDLLEARLDVDGRPLTIFANHWKSGASDPKSESARISNAKDLRKRIDEILRENPLADIIVAGDLNSHYNQNQRYPELKKTGVIDVLGTQGSEPALVSGQRDLYDLWFELPSKERRSDIYRDEWGTLMHLVVSRGLYDNSNLQYVDNSFRVLSFPGLNTDVFGRPLRWFRGARPGGFSDHFPIMAKFRTVDSESKDSWMALKNPSTTEQGDAKPLLLTTSAELFKNAIDPTKKPEVDYRDGSYQGRIFSIHAPAKVDNRGQITVSVNGQDFGVYSHNKKVFKRLRELAESTNQLHFYGALGTYKGQWQFVLYGNDWIASQPSSLNRKSSPFVRFAGL